MPIFPVITTEDLVQSGDKTRIDGSKSFASGASELSSVLVRPSADEAFYAVVEGALDWVYFHSGPNDPMPVVATVRAASKLVIDASNDKLEFTLSAAPATILVATVAQGEYAVYHDLFTAIETALAAATATPYPDLTWSVVADGDFVEIILDGMDNVSGNTLKLLVTTGGVPEASILPLLGFEEDTTIARALIPLTAQAFAQDFAADAGFTYDPAVAEFTAGLLRQVYQRLANATFGATYTNSIDGSWGWNSLAGTAFGGAKVTGGRLDLTGGTGGCVEYVASGKTDTLGHTGCIRLKFTPNYNGVPVDTQTLFVIQNAEGDSKNAISLFHHPNGSFFLYANDKDGNNIFSNSLTSFTAVAGEQHEIELSWDAELGVTRVFGDGFLFAEIDGTTWVRDDASVNYFAVGNKSLPGSDMFIDDVEVFLAPQNTGDHAAGYVVPEADYLANKVDLPAFNYGGLGALQSLQTFTTTEAGSPRYIVGGKYWTGSAWAVSDGSYAQANPKATISANITTLAVGGTTLSLSVVFPNANTVSSVDQLGVGYTGQQLDTSVSPEGDVAPVSLFKDASKTISIITAAKDNLFSDDDRLRKHEWDILKFVPDGRASFLDVHRRAQQLIMAWLDTNGFIDDFGDKFTVADVKNPDDFQEWATMMVLRLIFEGVTTAKDDIYRIKAGKYQELEDWYRNRANVRIDLNADGVTDNREKLDTRSCMVVRR